ncbi:MAG TPA: iron dependent repressor, metal binding and dimerization domain protein, partial [Methanoculleus sp.]|nr:iron dependent repressor, metal binding and dimerization domain protein [Methanoculleus sp.]
ETLRAFLTLIRVPEEVASRDACIMEHELSPETIEQIRHFVEFIGTDAGSPDLLRRFEGFCRAKRSRAGAVDGSRPSAAPPGRAARDRPLP